MKQARTFYLKTNMESQLKRFFVFLGVAVGAALVMAQMKISQYPNTATLADADMFIVASGSTNKQIRWSQLKSLTTNALSTNLNLTVNNITINTNLIVRTEYVTNLYVTTNYITNAYINVANVTNLYVSTNYTTNLFVTEQHVTNQYVYQTNFVNNSFTTNLTVVSNLTVQQNINVTSNINVTNILNAKTINVTNLNVTNIVAGSGLVSSNIDYVMNTVVPDGTNVIVDMALACQVVDAAGNLYLLQTTNRPTTGNYRGAILRIRNYSGSDVTLSHNTSAVWVVSGGTTPITLTNNTWNTFCFGAWGDKETNVSVGINTWKAQ